jgi:hypothetical protein
MKALLNSLLTLTFAGALICFPTQPRPAMAETSAQFGHSEYPNAELAGARNATAKYHLVEQAEADGYISIDFCEPGEGCHWLKPSLVDGTFDPEQPEILLYAPDDNGNLRLVAVEYVVPLSASLEAPAGFTGDSDEWREDTESAGLWELTAWIWLNNPNGLFEQHNPRVP